MLNLRIDWRLVKHILLILMAWQNLWVMIIVNLLLSVIISISLREGISVKHILAIISIFLIIFYLFRTYLIAHYLNVISMLSLNRLKVWRKLLIWICDILKEGLSRLVVHVTQVLPSQISFFFRVFLFQLLVFITIIPHISWRRTGYIT